MSTGWILTFVAVVVALCAFLAAMGFKGRISTIGVDLGTTFSVVGYKHNGEVRIVADRAGRRLFPSVVHFAENGETRAAHDALPFLETDPARTIYNAKRFIGKSLDEETRMYASEHPFKVVSSTRSNYSNVAFSLSPTEEVSPEEVGVSVLRHLLNVVSDALGHKQVNKAVIAVPAKFNSVQRQATAHAYKQAGLKVVRVIEEPTAAAVAYDLHKKAHIHHILVFDWGGGTLDVSLLYVAQGSVQVYATDGDDTLGGSDLDVCLLSIIEKKVEAATGQRVPVSLPLTDSLTQKGLSQDSLCTLAALHTQAENAKKRLTTESSVEIICHFPHRHADTHNEMHTELQRVSVWIEREDFLSGCNALFERALLPAKRLLESLEMSVEDVDEVVLVGGSTRVPHIKQLLTTLFRKPLNDHIDPDVTVAYGAASILD